MPVFIPPYCGEEIKSNAEKKIFDVLQKLQTKNTFVLHSLGLPKHESKIYGEVDFVVVCERGVACLEVKGGRVECRQGRWYFTDRYGVERQKPEGPFAQVTGNMFSLKKLLKRQFSDNRHMKNILVASGVVFPDIDFTVESAEIIEEIVYDRQTEDVTNYMDGIFDYWKERQHGKSSKLSPSDIDSIVDFFRQDFTFIPTLNNRLNDVDRRLVRLTNEQFGVMEGLSANEHLLIEGGAGTGKTLLAADFARKQAEKGNRVLYVVFNKNLANNINRMVEHEHLKVINIHALFGDIAGVDLKKLNENPRHYFANDLPNEFYNYMCHLDEATQKELKWDVLVLDEGQDILRPNDMYALDCLIKGGFDHGKWAVFYDENQNIYNPEFELGLELLSAYQFTKFKLFINCRNTVQIGEFNAQVTQTAETVCLKEKGEEVEVIDYKDEKEFKERMTALMKRLKSEKIPLEEVVFLSPKKYINSILSIIDERTLNVNEMKDGFVSQKGIPVYATIQGFKGLDAKSVILIDIDKIYEKNYKRYMYTAISRARTKLFLFTLPEQNPLTRL
ncbi:MAG: NERD domain-containing protein [Eubacterium sp.]